MEDFMKVYRYFTWRNLSMKKIVFWCIAGFSLFMCVILANMIAQEPRISANPFIMESYRREIASAKIGIIIFLCIAVIFWLFSVKKPGNIISCKQFDQLKDAKERTVLASMLQKNGITEKMLLGVPHLTFCGYLYEKIKMPVYKKIDTDGQIRSSLCQVTSIIMEENLMKIYQSTFSLINNEYYEKQYTFKRKEKVNIISETQRITISGKCVDNQILNVFTSNDKFSISAGSNTDLGTVLNQLNGYFTED